MSEDRFDLSFDGTLTPGADPAEVRQRLMAAFKLDEGSVERLFRGHTVIVKRRVDAATARQFQQVFARAGAMVNLAPAGPEHPRETRSADADAPSRFETPSDSARLTLAPPGALLEEPSERVAPSLDLSHLSVVPGDDWTLEDCGPLPTPIPEPDISHLSLADDPDRYDSKPWNPADR